MSKYAPHFYVLTHACLISEQIKLNGQIQFAEVQFYFLHFATDEADETPCAYALVSLYSCPIQSLLDESSHTLWACHYCSDDDLRVVRVSTIISCVSMQPLPRLPTDPDGLWFVMEKSGLEDFRLTGGAELLEQELGRGLANID